MHGIAGVSDVVPTFGIQAIHHTLDQLDLVLQGKIDKVGIHKYAVGRTQSRVVLEEHGRSSQFHMPLFLVFLLRVGDRFFFIGFASMRRAKYVQSCVIRIQHTLYGAKLAHLFLLAHGASIASPLATRGKMCLVLSRDIVPHEPSEEPCARVGGTVVAPASEIR